MVQGPLQVAASRVFSMHESNQDLRSQLRQIMKIKRKNLTEDQQAKAAKSIIPQALSIIHHYQSQHIALYLPFDGEISPVPLMDILLAQGKKIYLPILHPFTSGQLLFINYHCKTSLKYNRFKIQEPILDIRNVIPLSQLEMIFTPLVACDKVGNRLGMGGGFYDRTLSQAPHIISVGLAHQCQQVEQLPIENWDIPLNHIILGE